MAVSDWQVGGKQAKTVAGGSVGGGQLRIALINRRVLMYYGPQNKSQHGKGKPIWTVQLNQTQINVRVDERALGTEWPICCLCMNECDSVVGKAFLPTKPTNWTTQRLSACQVVLYITTFFKSSNQSSKLFRFGFGAGNTWVL